MSAYRQFIKDLYQDARERGLDRDESKGRFHALYLTAKSVQEMYTDDFDSRKFNKDNGDKLNKYISAKLEL